MKIEFNVNDRIAHFFIRIFKGKQVFLGFLFAFSIGSALVYAVAPLTITNTFVSGDTISAAQMNQNFLDIKAKVDELAGETIPVGTIVPFAGSAAPTGWLLCNGAAINRTTYNKLFVVIGNLWGSGDNSNTFNIPDLRGIFLRGVDGAAAKDPDSASRSAINPGGSTGNNVGSYQLDAFQGHVHGLQCKIDTTYSITGGTFVFSNPPSVPYNYFTTDSAKGPVDDGTHGVPRISFENRPKNANVNYIIKY